MRRDPPGVGAVGQPDAEGILAVNGAVGRSSAKRPVRIGDARCTEAGVVDGEAGCCDR